MNEWTYVDDKMPEEDDYGKIFYVTLNDGRSCNMILDDGFVSQVIAWIKLPEPAPLKFKEGYYWIKRKGEWIIEYLWEDTDEELGNFIPKPE